MPIYEYRCDSGHNFDVMQRMSEDPLTACEVCGAPAQRVLHAPAVHFKGSGFYNTDYGTKKRARELRSSAEGSSRSDSASTGSDSKSGTSTSDTGSSNGGTRSDSNTKASAAS